MPLHCFRCDEWFAVPFRDFRAGTVFRCPRCRASLVATLPLVTAVRRAVADFEAAPERRAPADLEARLRALVAAERLPGTPRPRRSAFAF